MKEIIKASNKKKAADCGLHPNVISALQRAGIIPRDVKNCTPEQDVLLDKLRIIIGDKELIKMQLSRFTKTKRAALVTDAGDFDLKPWELYALKQYIKLYKTPDANMTSIKLQGMLTLYYGIECNPQTRKRLKQLRIKALYRVKKEASK